MTVSQNATRRNYKDSVFVDLFAHDISAMVLNKKPLKLLKTCSLSMILLKKFHRLQVYQ
ncbi:MAG: hypothetical protein IJ361_07470 [Spirochaetaceae bacterium]|nr:hypothetical protein [Spirochaetaceae bacterium]